MQLVVILFLLLMKKTQYKALETALTLPSTGIAAHALDEDVEVVETDDRSHVVVGPSNGPEDTIKTPRPPFLPPPPPISKNAYLQVFLISKLDAYLVNTLQRKHISMIPSHVHLFSRLRAF